MDTSGGDVVEDAALANPLASPSFVGDVRPRLALAMALKVDTSKPLLEVFASMELGDTHRRAAG